MAILAVRAAQIMESLAGYRSLGVSESLYRAVLLIYIIGVSGFNRDFARLHIDVAGIPLFVGEATIGVLAGLLVLSWVRGGRPPLRFDPTVGSLLGYLGIGALFATGGLWAGYGLAALRDFALVYYVLFFFLAVASIQTTVRPLNLLRAMALGGSVGSALAVLRFVVSRQLVWEHGAPGYLALIAWVAVVSLVLFRHEARTLVAKSLYAVALILCGATIFISGYRTLIAVMFAGLALVWVASLRSLGSVVALDKRSPMLLSVFVLVLVLGTAGLFVTLVDTGGTLPVHGTPSLLEAAESVSSRWVRGTTAPLSQPTLSFRLSAWRNALNRITSSPIIGMGYGPPPELYPEEACEIAPSLVSNCGNAHNSYLTLMMRMGIPAFFFFVAINALVLYRFLAALQRGAGGPDGARLGLLALVAYVSFAVYAFMSLFFESPYLSSLYWVVLAIMHHLASQREVSNRQAAR